VVFPDGESAMSTKIRTTMSVSLFILMALAALMSAVVLRADHTRAASLQSGYDICATQMHVCPGIQVNWSNLH
jgi:hypothetical protein